MTSPVFGITINREANEAATPSRAQMSVVGICMPIDKATTAGSEAFDAAFPLDRPVRLNSNDSTRLSLCDQDGGFIDALKGINAQLGRYQTAAELVVVRVEEGEDADETMANIVGSSVLGTGIHAFLFSGAEVGVYPRLILCPGFTVDRDTGVASISIGAGGADYAVGDAISGTGGGGTGFAGEVATVDGSGAITGVTITEAGSGYTGAPTLAVTSDAGSGATLTATVADLANPVAAALPAVCAQILAVAIVDGPATLADFTEWRETLSSERLIPVSGGVYAIDSAGDEQLRPASPRVAGLAVRRDYEGDGSPFRSWANQALYGITGPERPMRFSLTDGATEGQQILAAQGGIIVRGEAGDDFAIADGGYVYIGTDTLSAETIWSQYHKVRGRDFIELTALRTGRQMLGRFNLTTQTIQSVINTLNVICAQRQAAGDILGYRNRFDPDRNNAADLRAGHIYTEMKFEEAPVFRRLSVSSQPYAAALDATIEDILARQDLF